MKKIINIDLIDKYDFLERYNQNKVSANFIEYLLKEAKYVSKETNIEININVSLFFIVNLPLISSYFQNV